MLFIYLPQLYATRPGMYSPLGVMILASMLEKSNIEVGIKNYSHLSVSQAIEDLPPRRVYGITCTSLELPSANKFSKLIKEKYPESKVILGGPGTISDEFVDWNYVDSIVKGEAELVIMEIIEDVRDSSLKKIYKGRPILDLNGLPFPARHLGGFGCNIFSWDTGDDRSAVLLTGRGCPFNCAFCASRFLNKRLIRYRSVDNVIQEIREIKETYGIRQFRILDEMLNAKKKRIYEFCEKVESLDIHWRLPLRVRPLDLDMLRTMRKAGCREVSFGVESFDKNVLKMLNKETTPRDNARALFLSHEAGLVTRCFILIRTPGQTEKTIPINIKYLEVVPYDLITCSTLIPFPGCDIWFNPEKYNIEIMDRDLEHYNMWSYGPKGEVKWPDIIRPLDRDLETFNKEAEEMKVFLKSTGKWNVG